MERNDFFAFAQTYKKTCIDPAVADLFKCSEDEFKAFNFDPRFYEDCMAGKSGLPVSKSASIPYGNVLDDSIAYLQKKQIKHSPLVLVNDIAIMVIFKK